MFAQTQDLRFVDERWHEFARDAKRTTSSLDDWSQREINRWDLDDEVREPTGEFNPRTYEYDPPLEDVVESSPERQRRRIDIRQRKDR